MYVRANHDTMVTCTQGEQRSIRLDTRWKQPSAREQVLLPHNQIETWEDGNDLLTENPGYVHALRANCEPISVGTGRS